MPAASTSQPRRARGRHSIGDRLLAAEATLWLGLFRAALLLVPFRYITATLKLSPLVPKTLDPTPPGPDGDPGAKVGWAVQAAAVRTPWQSTCLVQSLAGLIMLRRRGVDSVLYLGVRKANPDELAAHSWLSCGQRVVIGDSGRGAFSAIAAYN